MRMFKGVFYGAIISFAIWAVLGYILIKWVL